MASNGLTKTQSKAARRKAARYPKEDQGSLCQETVAHPTVTPPILTDEEDEKELTCLIRGEQMCIPSMIPEGTQALSFSEDYQGLLIPGDFPSTLRRVIFEGDHNSSPFEGTFPEGYFSSALFFRSNRCLTNIFRIDAFVKDGITNLRELTIHVSPLNLGAKIGTPSFDPVLPVANVTLLRWKGIVCPKKSFMGKYGKTVRPGTILRVIHAGSQTATSDSVISYPKGFFHSFETVHIHYWKYSGYVPGCFYPEEKNHVILYADTEEEVFTAFKFGCPDYVHASVQSDDDESGERKIYRKAPTVPGKVKVPKENRSTRRQAQREAKKG